MEGNVMNGQHPIVLAMVRKHLAEAELTLARLESQARAVPATTRSNNSMMLLTRKIREAKSVLAAWVSVERQAQS